MVKKRVRAAASALAVEAASAPPPPPATILPERRVSARIRESKSAMQTAVVKKKEDNAGEDAPPKKRKRRTKVDEPVVYDIPPVERKVTTWRGRLGYACLNTILRNSKPEPTFCSRTCRIDTILKNDLNFAKNLGFQNAKDLCKLIQWNEDNKIRFMRISSEMFPFASHGEYGYSLDYAAAELKAAGDLANSLGHRMTLHPGQFTQLGSPKENVVTASVRELKYHCSMLNLMGMGKDSVIIIHMGGVYGDKPATLERFKQNYTTKLSEDIKARLVLENDELCYNADDLLPVCEELNIPIIFDYHHNWIYPSTLPLPSLLPRINALWHRKGIKPKQHLSSPRPGAVTIMERRAHAGRCAELPAELELEGAGWWYVDDAREECKLETNRQDGENGREKEYVDLMIEAKDKEQAVLQLYRTYGLEEVVWGNLRPEKADAGGGEGGGKKGGGKKTRARKKVEDEGQADEDKEVVADAPDEDPVVEVDASQESKTGEQQSRKKRRTKRPNAEVGADPGSGDWTVEVGSETFVLPTLEEGEKVVGERGTRKGTRMSKGAGREKGAML